MPHVSRLDDISVINLGEKYLSWYYHTLKHRYNLNMFGFGVGMEIEWEGI